MKFSIKQLVVSTVFLFWVIPSNTWAESHIKVHVSILPQKYFVERIGNDRVQVDVLVKPGKNPTTYSPSPDQIKKLVSSHVYFRIGVSFETALLQRIRSLFPGKIVDTRQGIELRNMEGNHTDHTRIKTPGDSQDNKTDHPHDQPHTGPGGKDPHIWMNPLLVKKQAHTIFTTLSEIDPEGKKEYETNYNLFVRDLDALDHRLKTALIDFKGENLLVFHPSFGYFADAYGMKQVAVETMGKTPKGKTLSRIIKLAKSQTIRVIFVQPQFDRNAAQKIAAAINGSVVDIDPLAFNYLTNMETIAKTITETLKQ